MPIYEGGSRQKRVDEATHQVRESQAQLDDVKIQTQARAQSATEAVKRTWAGVESRKTALDVAGKELVIAQRRQEIGVGTDLELVEQETKTAQAKDDYEEALATYQMARVTLAQALGHMESLVNKQ